MVESNPMTLQAMTWAFRQPLKSTEKMVLLCLADHTNHNNECWPSQDSLSEKAGVSRSTLNLALKSLESAGFIDRKQRIRDKGGKDRTVYTLYVSDKIECPTIGHRDVPEQDIAMSDGDTIECPTTGQPNVPQSDMNSINPNLEPKEEPNRSTSLETAYRLWNELAEEFPSLPKARPTQGPAQENLKARLKIGGLEGFARALEGVRRSDNHQNIKNWTGMNLGWMVESPKKYERMQNLADAPKPNGAFNGNGSYKNGNGVPDNSTQRTIRALAQVAGISPGPPSNGHDKSPDFEHEGPGSGPTIEGEFRERPAPAD